MKTSTMRKTSRLQDKAHVLGTSEVMELEKQKHHKHMEIIRAWDLCVYISHVHFRLKSHGASQKVGF